MTAPKAEDVKRGIAVIWENLQCPICLDLMNAPVSTRCDHQFCKFCMMKLLEKSKRKEANCPVCKMKVTKRSLQESPGFQRLVEGLQNLVQSYEFDTCTSYLTGTPQKRKETSVETQSSDQQCSEENAFSENDIVEKSASRSSTAAAKDAFAQLMDLPASCPVSSQQDCSDSGVGDLPQDSEKKPAELEDVPSTLEVRQNNLLTCNDGREDAETNIPQKRSGRRAKRIGLEPDRIVDKRQKKSVEKVAEWLLKISPSSDTQAKDKTEDLPTSNDGDSERESICSSSSTVVNVKANDKDDVSPPREVPGRGLEEQVFGAVYKRQRKGAKSKVNRPPEKTPERHVVTDPDPINLVVEEEGIKRNIPKRKRSHTLTPADSVKKSSHNKGERVVCDQTEDPKESVVHNVEESKQDHVDESNTDGPIKCVEQHEKVIENSIDEKCDGKVENMEESPVFEVPVKRPGRRSKIKMQNAWKDLGCDLKKENICDDKTGRKRRISRNNCDSSKDGHSEESKNAKCAKSLTLVSTAGDEDVPLMKQLKSKPNLVEAEINIESYPSTAEPQSPDARKTRRSLRLQAFVAEVQGARKRRRSTRTPLKPAHGSENNPSDNPSQSTCSNQPKADNTNANEDIADANQSNASAGQVQSEQTEKFVRKNGCVCNSDFEKIETVETVEEAATFTCIPEANVPDQSSLVSVVPDTADQGGQNVPCSSVAVSSPGPLVAVAPDSSIPLKRQESPSTGVVAPSVVQTLTHGALMSAGENGSMDVEGDTNDSELDTELLMKSFKGTKRKSFYLGSPGPLHTETQQDALEKTVDEEKQLPTEIPVIAQDSDPRSGLANNCQSDLPSNPCELASYEKPPQRSQSSFGNTGVVSISLLQAKSPALASDNQEDAFLKSTSNSPSSGLSPNKVARSSQDSRLSTNSCQLFFVGTTQDAQICSSKGLENEQSSKLTCQSRTSDIQKETQGNDLQAKVSLDPIKSLDIPIGGLLNSGVHSNNLESSITPDGLLPECAGSHALQMIEPVTSQSLDKVKEKEAEILSQPCVRKKRKAQRLESSESELSAEEDDLPTMAQIFKSHCSPLPSGQEEPLSDLADQDGHQLQEPNPGLQSPSQHSRPLSEPAPGTQSSQLSQCVSPSQNREHLENVNATTVGAAVEDDNLPEPPCRDEWISSSQGSVDLFGTPEESEAVDGICGNVDSSQYSSEIINTQQKEEMQQELRRLERMMALVSEALQKKESDLEAKAQTEGPDLSHSDQHTAADLGESGRCDPGNPSDRQSGPDSGRDHVCVPPSPRAPDGLEAPQSHAPLTRGQAKTGRQTGRGGQKSRNSRKRSSRKSEVGPEVKDHSVASEDSPTGSMKGKEAKEPQREGSVSGMCRLGINSTAGKMEVVASGLSASELAMVKKFVRKMHGSLSKEMTPSTSHVIIKTDADLVCERTLKYFQGIAGRKWVVSYFWISECFKQGRVLDEAQFEVRGDVINGRSHNGPLKSRTTAYDNLLMKGYEICFQGSFTGMTTDQMEAMVEMCGATVMKDPLMFSKHGVCQLVVVQPGSDDSQSYYRALQKKATVVTRGWLLDTIATYTLQNPEDYKP
ncbi:breast cancer type 1 susceptibility protein homolog isoform X2 [Colossoma macropomum]|uniref:breast cancer type 1 susceptibility protein homolog isoform X2 n=1 Tax=Colossoma macropomum TaxID=42526 RepID=UPI001864E95A|nr:breast cancer type 1 susceptibility protein homolog isoform X2 [Colossoma macropomum]